MANLESLLPLKDQDLEKQITEIHCDKICHTINLKWRRLPPYLGLESEPLISDIETLSIEEEEKRGKFVSKWKEIKGSDATYKNLIDALYKIDSKDDAEHVHKLLLLDSRPQHLVTSHGPELSRQDPAGMYVHTAKIRLLF